MRRIIVVWMALAILTGVWGCGQKGAKLQKSVVPPDRTLFETGQEFLDKSQFIKSRLAFQTLINTYPDSELTSESYLAIGDSFYEEGGTENLLQAEDQYKNFIIFFPTHPKAADAQMKIVSLNMKMMRAPDRDQTYAEKAQAALQKFLKDFPDHVYGAIARNYLNQVQETLAQSDFSVGRFYFERGNPRGSNSRFKEIVDKYPNFSAMDETYWLLAQGLEKQENSDEAAIYLSRIAAGYPFSRHYEEARKRLEELKKPVPEVDQVAAAQNQARIKPSEGFSPLRPFSEFAKALGFIGPPDPYENAKRTVEAQAESAAAAASENADGKGGENVLINVELSKSATGETSQKATVGGETKETTPGTDKKGEKKDDKKKANKKKKGN